MITGSGGSSSIRLTGITATLTVLRMLNGPAAVQEAAEVLGKQGGGGRRIAEELRRRQMSRDLKLFRSKTIRTSTSLGAGERLWAQTATLAQLLIQFIPEVCCMRTCKQNQVVKMEQNKILPHPRARAPTSP